MPTGERVRQVLVFGIALATVVASLGIAAPAHAATPAKVAIIVGPVGEELTPVYISLADAAANAAETRGATVAKAYSPDADAEQVLKAVEGANIVIYLGHGVGTPNPYSDDPKLDHNQRLGPERAEGQRQARRLGQGRGADLLRRGVDRGARPSCTGLGDDLLECLLRARRVGRVRQAGRREAGGRPRGGLQPRAAGRARRIGLLRDRLLRGRRASGRHAAGSANAALWGGLRLGA